MDNKQQMQAYMDKVREATERVQQINEVIDREVDRRYAHRIGNGNSPQERKNLRQHYRKRIAAENVYLGNAKGERDLCIQLAQMHGIAAMLDEVEEDRPQRNSL